MITADEAEFLSRVLDVCDPASDCSIGNDEIGRARDIIEREVGQNAMTEDERSAVREAVDNALSNMRSYDEPDEGTELQIELLDSAMEKL